MLAWTLELIVINVEMNKKKQYTQYIKLWREIGANPALCSNLRKKNYPSRGSTNHEKKKQRRGYSQTVFWHEKNGGLCDLSLCMLVCNKKNMEMFIATGLTVKRW